MAWALSFLVLLGYLSGKGVEDSLSMEVEPMTTLCIDERACLILLSTLNESVSIILSPKVSFHSLL